VRKIRHGEASQLLFTTVCCISIYIYLELMHIQLFHFTTLILSTTRLVQRTWREDRVLSRSQLCFSCLHCVFKRGEVPNRLEQCPYDLLFEKLHITPLERMQICMFLEVRCALTNPIHKYGELQISRPSHLHRTLSLLWISFWLHPAPGS
jgi:hypothetical protein